MKLEKKQKILLTLVIIAFAYLAWQLYDIFFANNQPPTTEIMPISQPMSDRLQPSLTPTTTPTMPSIAPVASTTQPPTPTIPAINKPSVATTPILTAATPVPAQRPAAPPVMRQYSIQAPMTRQQMEYLRLVNRYQIIKMQRLVADEEAAMYASRAKIAELHQQMSKYSGTSTNNNLFGTSGSSMSIGYQLMYIDYQNGAWTATLNQSGRFIEVHVNDVLPDGARILKINQNGVVVRKWNRNYLLNFYGTSLLRNYPAPIMRPTPLQAMHYPVSYPLPVTNNSTIIPPANNISQNTTAATPIKPSMMTQAPLTTANRQQLSSQPLTATHTTVLAPAATSQIKIYQSLPPAATEARKNIVVKPLAKNEKKPLPSLEKKAKNTPMAIVTPSNNLKTPLKPETTVMVKNIEQPVVPANTSIVAVIPPKKEVPLTSQQKTTVTQLESYIDNKNANPAQSHSSDEKHLLSLPGEHYTLQIMGSYKLSDLVDAIKANNLKDKAYTFHTLYMDKDWYVLIYGVYKTQDEALAAINTLPPAVQRLKPWVRTIGSVHEAIKLNPKQD